MKKYDKLTYPILKIKGRNTNIISADAVPPSIEIIRQRAKSSWSDTFNFQTHASGIWRSRKTHQGTDGAKFRPGSPGKRNVCVVERPVQGFKIRMLHFEIQLLASF